MFKNIRVLRQCSTDWKSSLIPTIKIGASETGGGLLSWRFEGFKLFVRYFFRTVGKQEPITRSLQLP